MRKVLTTTAAALALSGGGAEAQSLIDVCTGLSVNLPVLNQLTGGVYPLVSDLNLIFDQLSGKNISATVLDADGNVVSLPSGNCKITTNGVAVEAPGGIAIGGGQVRSLGSRDGTLPGAPEVNSIAIGNGAQTGTALHGTALGTKAGVNSNGGVALGSGALAERAGLNGAAEAFSGTSVGSTQGAVSVGTTGAERQITNLAGGTQDTDAVNLRQLRAVGDSLAGSLGGGASFDEQGTFTLPRFVVDGQTYDTVSAAIAALDASGSTGTGGGSITPGGTTIAAGDGAVASGASSTALGAGASATSAGGVALGSGAVADRAGMAGATEAFSGTAVASTQGAVSVGAAGAERQITNVAGGTQDTDAVNVRQVRAVGDSLAGSLGGGAGFDAQGNFTGPSYVVRGASFRDVGSALIALDLAGSAVASDDSSNAGPAVASGADSAAVGNGAVASGDGSTALGNRASAAGAGSTALGAGAAATRPGQVAIGTGISTYTLPGLATPASRAAQRGPTQVVTTDAYGNLASIPVDLLGLEQQVHGLARDVHELRRETRQGIAAAMAMVAAPMPTQPGRTSWSGHTATYRGQWAAGISVAHRLNLAVPVAVHAGVSLAGDGFGGARVGLSGEF